MAEAPGTTIKEPDFERSNSAQEPRAEQGSQQGVLAELAVKQWTSSGPHWSHGLIQNPQFEIPTQMREFAQKNVEQARGVYGQYMQAACRLLDMMGAMVPANATTVGIKAVHEQMMRFIRQNVDANFSLASELAKAKDFQEMFEIQSRHAQTQMQAYSSQAQELGRRMVGAAHTA